jgi:hypothetical protein
VKLESLDSTFAREPSDEIERTINMNASLPYRMKLWIFQLLIGGAIFLHSTPLFAQEEEETEEPEWVISYALILLITFLGVYLIVRTSKRSERATEEKYEVKGLGDLLKNAKPAKKRTKKRGKVEVHPEANSALTISVVGCLVLGFPCIFGLIKGLKAKKQIQSDPRVTGENQALAAIIVSCVGMVLWLIGYVMLALNFLM